MAGIDLRLSDVDPPLPEPKRTIYRDIVNLPDPVILGMTIRYFNFDDVTLYFQITGSGTGYSFGTVNLGSLASGANAYINLDNFASRAKPSAGSLINGELDEQITLTLRAYTDAGYSILKWTFNRVISVKFINSSDPAFTVDIVNNFDDGTVQGWAGTGSGLDAGFPQVAVATDYVLSVPYSLKMTSDWYITGPGQKNAYLFKSITTPNRNTVYAIVDIRVSELESDTRIGEKNLRVRNGTTDLIFLGGPYAASTITLIPLNKWMRLIVPLAKNSVIDLRYFLEWHVSAIGVSNFTYVWIDDFKVISKN